MKKLTLSLLFGCIASISFSQAKISVDSSAGYIGKLVTVCAKVNGVKELEKINFFNLGKAFPNAPLTLVINAKDKANFKALGAYDGKNICVTGTITEFKGKPQIVVTKAEEIVEAID